jgi:hypothetical protein
MSSKFIENRSEVSNNTFIPEQREQQKHTKVNPQNGRLYVRIGKIPTESSKWMRVVYLVKGIAELALACLLIPLLIPPFRRSLSHSWHYVAHGPKPTSIYLNKSQYVLLPGTNIPPNSDSTSDSSTQSSGEGVPTAAPSDSSRPNSDSTSVSSTQSSGEDVPTAAPSDSSRPNSDSTSVSLTQSSGESVPSAAPSDSSEPVVESIPESSTQPSTEAVPSAASSDSSERKRRKKRRKNFAESSANFEFLPADLRVKSSKPVSHPKHKKKKNRNKGAGKVHH